MGRKRQDAVPGESLSLYGLNVRVSKDILYLIDKICAGEGISRSGLIAQSVRTYAELKNSYIEVPESAVRDRLAFLLELQELCLKMGAVVGDLIPATKSQA